MSSLVHSLDNFFSFYRNSLFRRASLYLTMPQILAPEQVLHSQHLAFTSRKVAISCQQKVLALQHANGTHIMCGPAFTFVILDPYKGHSKNNEANVLQNGPKIKHLWYMTTNMSKPSQQNKFPACNIFELPHYFWNDPYSLLLKLINWAHLCSCTVGSHASPSVKVKGHEGQGQRSNKDPRERQVRSQQCQVASFFVVTDRYCFCFYIPELIRCQLFNL